MEVTITDRGFKHTEPMVLERGEVIRVYESSAAFYPAIWLHVSSEGVYGEGKEVAVAHLTLDDVDELIERLQYLKENHYHFEE